MTLEQRMLAVRKAVRREKFAVGRNGRHVRRHIIRLAEAMRMLAALELVQALPRLP